MTINLRPSIYDLTLEALDAWDFSRPLFVQAVRSPQFNELVDVFHGRLGLPPHRSTMLTNRTYPGRPWWPGRHLTHPDARLSAGTADHVRALSPEPFSVVVMTTQAPIGDYYQAMRFHSNVACFCHAMEPTPVCVLNEVGQFAPAREYFQIRDYVVGPEAFVGNMLVAPAESEALYEAALARPDGHIVEIGRFSGGTAVLFALAARKSGRPGVMSIDCTRLPSADHFRRANGVERDVEFIDGDSSEIASCWRDLHSSPGISLLFIDADHSYDGVARDLAAWIPYVVDGGTIALHDNALPDCGVSKAVYHHLAGRDGFTNFRQVCSTVFCERRAV